MTSTPSLRTRAKERGLGIFHSSTKKKEKNVRVRRSIKKTFVIKEKKKERSWEGEELVGVAASNTGFKQCLNNHKAGRERKR